MQYPSLFVSKQFTDFIIIFGDKKFNLKSGMQRLSLFCKVRKFEANNEAHSEILIEIFKASAIILDDVFGILNRILQTYISKVKNKLKIFCKNSEKFRK